MFYKTNCNVSIGNDVYEPDKDGIVDVPVALPLLKSKEVEAKKKPRKKVIKESDEQ